MPSSVACLSFDPAPGTGDDEIGLGRHRAGDLGAQPLGHRLGLAARHLLERAGEDDGLAGDLAVGRDGDDIGLGADLLEQRVEHLVVALVAEEVAAARRSPCRRCRRSTGRRCGSSAAAVSLPTRMNSSMVEKVLASSAAVVSPMWRMPSAKMKRSSSGSRRASMAANSLSRPS